MREQQFYHLRQELVRAAKRLREWFRSQPQLQRRLISGGLGLAVIAILALVATFPAITSASEVDALGNGGFEQGFYEVNGCGVVGNHWDCFTNGGAAAYGFYDDQWEPVVYEGRHSQLVEINTKNMAAGDNDRYAGISQTTRVVKGQPYQFSLRGMIRTTNSEGDPWRYSVQVGWLNEPKGDWRDVDNWMDVGWNTYYNRTEPGAFSAFQTQLVPQSEAITIFVRVWKKWGVAYEEVDVNLDAISLTGPAVHRGNDGPQQDGPRPDSGKPESGRYDGVGGPVQGQEYRPEQFQPQAPQGPDARGPQNEQSKPENRPTYRPVAPAEEYPVSCGGSDLIYNGSFEGGFVEVPWGVVGKGWNALTNGGAANYGFYDEEWDIVVADGNHGQLIEINTKSIYPTEHDRYAGISQRIAGLHPGATYELTLRGELRGEGNEDDPYRFAAQWGLGKDGDWLSVDEWTTMDLGPIAVRTQPLPLAQYKVRFEAPAPSVVLFIRGWKKFGITNVEMDLNLDAISLRACDNKSPERPRDDWQEPQYPGIGGPTQQPGGQPDNPCRPGCDEPRPDKPRHDGAECLYVVKPGDTLSQIAVNYGVSMEAIIRANGIDDASAIYVGQKFEIPGCAEGKPSSEPVSRAADSQARPPQQWEIAEGARPEDAPERGGPAIRPTEQEPYPVEREQVNLVQEWQGPTAEELVYIVQPGDMLSWIAQEYSVNAYDLATYNGIDNLNFIYTGQVLLIPN